VGLKKRGGQAPSNFMLQPPSCKGWWW
jgi:hypothetical protein